LIGFLLWTTRVLFSGVMGASEQDFRIFSFPFGGGLFCLLANLSGALHQYSPVEPVPLRSPVRVSACGCGESYGVTAGRMLDGQTQETAVMREEQEKIVITTWKQIWDRESIRPWPFALFRISCSVTVALEAQLSLASRLMTN
jgi:hypothetical protein